MKRSSIPLLMGIAVAAVGLTLPLIAASSRVEKTHKMAHAFELSVVVYVWNTPSLTERKVDAPNAVAALRQGLRDQYAATVLAHEMLATIVRERPNILYGFSQNLFWTPDHLYPMFPAPDLTLVGS